jgi:hypothetical protein
MFVYSTTCFGRFSAHYQELNDCSGSLWFYLRIVVIAVLCSWSGRPARAGRAAGPTMNSNLLMVIYLNCTMMHELTTLKFNI